MHVFCSSDVPAYGEDRMTWLDQEYNAKWLACSRCGVLRPAGTLVEDRCQDEVWCAVHSKVVTQKPAARQPAPTLATTTAAPPPPPPAPASKPKPKRRAPAGRRK